MRVYRLLAMKDKVGRQSADCHCFKLQHAKYLWYQDASGEVLGPDCEQSLCEQRTHHDHQQILAEQFDDWRPPQVVELLHTDGPERRQKMVAVRQIDHKRHEEDEVSCDIQRLERDLVRNSTQLHTGRDQYESDEEQQEVQRPDSQYSAEVEARNSDPGILLVFSQQQIRD